MNRLGRIFKKYRYQVPLLLLVGVALYANLNLLTSRIRSYPDIRQGDAVTVYEARMLQIRDALPKSGDVGYITSVDNEKIFGREKTFEDVEILAHYILTQYTLAPVVIRNSPDYPLVIGNFVEEKPNPDIIKSKHLIPVKDYGDGLILYKKESRK